MKLAPESQAVKLQKGEQDRKFAENDEKFLDNIGKH